MILYEIVCWYTLKFFHSEPFYSYYCSWWSFFPQRMKCWTIWRFSWNLQWNVKPNCCETKAITSRRYIEYCLTIGLRKIICNAIKALTLLNISFVRLFLHVACFDLYWNRCFLHYQVKPFLLVYECVSFHVSHMYSMAREGWRSGGQVPTGFACRMAFIHEPQYVRWDLVENVIWNVIHFYRSRCLKGFQLTWK